MSEASVFGTDTAVLRKARGAFFTPPKVTEFIAEWAPRAGTEEVLEPSCGEAAFLIAAADRFTRLGVTNTPTLHGVELHAESAQRIEGRHFAVTEDDQAIEADGDGPGNDRLL